MQHTIVERARELAPIIRAASDEIEDTCRIPDHLDTVLEDAGLYQLYLPKAYGGPQVDPLSATQAIEEISKSDGSTGWVCMIGTVLSRRYAWMNPDIVQAMQTESGSLRAAGSNRALGYAQPEENGYLVNGRWDFQSGIEHASWMFGNCTLLDGKKPILDDKNQPITRVMAVPITSGNIIDTWDVIGLRGTGSSDFELTSVHVPIERSVPQGAAFEGSDPPIIEGLLYKQRFSGVWNQTVHAGCALGIARGALEEFRQLSSTHSSTMQSISLRERPFVQTKMGEAEAILRSARTYLFDAISETWEITSEQRSNPSDKIANLRLAITHAGNEAVRAVDLVFQAAGTNAAHTANRLERYFRDSHVAAQHGAAAPRNYEAAGRVFLGLPAGLGGW